MGDLDIQLQRNIENAAKCASDELQKSNEKILADIFFYSKDLLTQFPNDRLRTTMAHFAALLVSLSRQAEESTRKIVRLTWAIVILTIILVIATILLVMKEVDDKPNLKNTTYQETNKAKQPDVARPSMKK